MRACDPRHENPNKPVSCQACIFAKMSESGVLMAPDITVLTVSQELICIDVCPVWTHGHGPTQT